MNLLGVKTEVACGAVMRRGSTAAPASYIDFLEVSQSLRGVDLTVRDNPRRVVKSSKLKYAVVVVIRERT